MKGTLTAQCLAVQQDVTAIFEDWQQFNRPDKHALYFHGSVFVLDADGDYVTHLRWATPTDQAADDSLELAGMARSGLWYLDIYGRRVAAVAAGTTPKSVPHQRQPTDDRAVLTRSA